jgi:hypothetical protein
MHALRLPKHFVTVTYLVASALLAAGVWAFFHTPGKNGFDTIPLFWFLVIVSAPLVCLVCVVVLWRQKASPWWAASATLLLLPQAVVWLFGVGNFISYW